MAGAEQPDRFAGLVLIDTTIRLPGQGPQLRPPSGVLGLAYPTREDALARFRLRPPQIHPPVEVLAPVADYSLREVADGWAWKHDQFGHLGVDDALVSACAARLTMPVAYVYGEDSGLVDGAMAEYVRAVVPAPVRIARVPGAAHHVPLDAPEETARLIAESVAWLLAERPPAMDDAPRERRLL